jgi:hypothetical protein
MLVDQHQAAVRSDTRKRRRDPEAAREPTIAAQSGSALKRVVLTLLRWRRGAEPEAARAS